ncbi:hypothetical protein [Nocardioides alcanivorans]|uniref:hypothetical protein n=1 Tax=Nocardioides alcanivorans TaxID=2897352 RepID=UPI001F24FA22|nr:hypothetical protein [Nocardioides alcanivorans]
MDLLYLVQWLGCLAALFGGTAVLWFSDELPVRREPVRWVATTLGVLLLVCVLVLWLASTGNASRPTLENRATRLADAVQLVSLTFLVLFHTMAGQGTLHRWYSRGATLLAIGFGVVLSAGAQVSFPAVAWSESSWLQLGFFVVAGGAMHCALVSRDPFEGGRSTSGQSRTNGDAH